MSGGRRGRPVRETDVVDSVPEVPSDANPVGQRIFAQLEGYRAVSEVASRQSEHSLSLIGQLSSANSTLAASTGKLAEQVVRTLDRVESLAGTSAMAAARIKELEAALADRDAAILVKDETIAKLTDVRGAIEKEAARNEALTAAMRAIAGPPPAESLAAALIEAVGTEKAREYPVILGQWVEHHIRAAAR